MNDRQKITNAIRDPAPCTGCQERFTACSDRCPKDKRGEYGYRAWKRELARVKNEKRKYLSRANVRNKGYNEGEKYGEE